MAATPLEQAVVASSVAAVFGLDSRRWALSVRSSIAHTTDMGCNMYSASVILSPPLLRLFVACFGWHMAEEMVDVHNECVWVSVLGGVTVTSSGLTFHGICAREMRRACRLIALQLRQVEDETGTDCLPLAAWQWQANSYLYNPTPWEVWFRFLKHRSMFHHTMTRLQTPFMTTAGFRWKLAGRNQRMYPLATTKQWIYEYSKWPTLRPVEYVWQEAGWVSLLPIEVGVWKPVSYSWEFLNKDCVLDVLAQMMVALCESMQTMLPHKYGWNILFSTT